MAVKTFAYAATLAFLGLATGTLAAQSVALDKSELRFNVKQMGSPTDGRFRKFTADVDFDPNKPEGARATIEVDLGSIDLNSAETETEVKRKPWFNVDAFPKAKFVMSGAKAQGGGKFEAAGKLTIKGVSRDITSPFTLKQQGGQSVVEGSFVLPRQNWKIGEGEWADPETVANDVQVRYKLLISGVPAAK